MNVVRAAILVAAIQGCAHADGIIAADASGDRVAAVRLDINRGALRIGPRDGAHLVDGRVHVDDVTLAPHVTSNSRGVSIIQDFAPDEGRAISWDLTLGTKPMRLDVHVVASENQHVDLGGRSVAGARLYNEAGHLDLRWSAPNRLLAEPFELWSIGYLEARNVARSRARRVEIKNVGLAEVDLGELIEPSILVDVVASAGTLVLTVPADVSARATFKAEGAQVEADGWTPDGPRQYVRGAGTDARVTIVVQTASGVVRLKTSPPTPTQ